VETEIVIDRLLGVGFLTGLPIALALIILPARTRRESAFARLPSGLSDSVACSSAGRLHGLGRTQLHS